MVTKAYLIGISFFQKRDDPEGGGNASLPGGGNASLPYRCYR